jgi:hypothetical protein
MKPISDMGYGWHPDPICRLLTPDGFAYPARLQMDPVYLSRAKVFAARPPLARNAGHRSRNLDRAAIAYPKRVQLRTD